MSDGEGWRMTRPIWAAEADKGWQAPLFQEFDRIGRREVERRLDEFAENYREHAVIWLRLQDEQASATAAAQARAENEARAEQLELHRRQTAAAEASAIAAARSAKYARLALVISTLAVVISLAALASSVAA